MIPIVGKFKKNDVFCLGPNMCYVNYSIPRALPMNHWEVKKIIKDGNVQRLEEKLLNGEGYTLLGHFSTKPKIKTFLHSVPIYIARIDMLQDSICKGNLRDLKALLENGNSSRNIYKISPMKLVCSKDLNGVTVLHKAVYYDFLDIIEWLVKNYPQTVHIKDKTLRIPLHYICSCSEVSLVWNLMLEAGADPKALDINNNTPSYYLEYSEHITLPNNIKSDFLDQNIPIKPSNIRIWIHERNIKQLANVIWAGLGDKLLTETSKQATVNKFLKATPYIMGIIREIHKAVIEDNLELLKRLNREPVPVEILKSKDQNGLTPLHKAVGLGRLSIIDYILSKNSKTVNISDNDSRTPLHYAFIAETKNIAPIYNRLVKAGANENLIDKNGKTPKGARVNDIPIDLLIVLPKAPRIASEFPASWDWNILYESVEKEKSFVKSKLKNKLIKKSETLTNLTTGTSKTSNTNDIKNINHAQNIDCIENTNSVENIDNNIDNFLNIENKITNNPIYKDNNQISLYKQRESQETNDTIINVDNSSNKENNNSINKDTNYTFLHTQSELQDVGDNIVNMHNSANNKHIDRKKRDTNYISLYTQSNFEDIDDNVDHNKKERNDDRKTRDTNYISLYAQSKLPDIDDNVNYHKVEENNDSKLGDTNYISLYTQSKLQDIDNNVEHNINDEINDHKKSDIYHTSLHAQSELQYVDSIYDDRIGENVENNDPKNDTKSKLQSNDDINNTVSKSNSFTSGEVRQALNNGLLDDILPLGGPVYKVNSLIDTNNITLFDKNETKSNETQEPINSAQIIVDKGNLDNIAEYILDGKHEQFIGIKSDMSEVQDFLDKIPFYVNKIDQIHRYCAIGDLDGLIQVLDRKKFCLARESKSGLGLTPLHTAALYEQLDVFEYLATKFPETIKLIDLHGQTPMDYVTSMPDQIFLNKLLNTKSIFGEFQTDYHAPQNFRKNGVTFKPEEIRKVLSYIIEPVDEEFSDSDMDSSSNNSGKLFSTIINASKFSVGDREYLNKAIGKSLTSGLENLIKHRPSNPTLFLAEHLSSHYDDQQSGQESGVLQPNDRPQNILNDDQSLIVAHLPRPWDIFSNYRPEFKSISRDEFGMSMIHSAASRTHNRNAFFQLLQELDVNIGLRNEHYKTPRDIAVGSNIWENVKTIDKYVVHIIARGEYNKVINLLLEGYNHILDLDTDKNIFVLSSSRGHSHISAILPSIPTFEENRERLHRAIRLGAQDQVEGMLYGRDNVCVMLAMAKNEWSRCSLHIAVLSQNENIVRFLAESFPVTLDVLDNIERTPLHYAMSVDQVETISTILIGCGAKRIVKDLKGRQPSYYFMNKYDIQKLLEEEEQFRI